MINNLFSQVSATHALTQLDAGDLGKLKANGMTFTIRAYRAEGLGHVSLMTAKGFFGLMRMDTLIINPTECDLPLYSYDRIYAMGNDTLIVELYHTFLAEADPLDAGKETPATAALKKMALVKEKYVDLPERDPGSHWYDSIKLPESISKKGKKAQSARLDALALEHLEVYLSAASLEESETLSETDTAAKRAKASVYVEGLLEKGGPSTDVFKKSLGEKTTAKLFRVVLFGTHVS